MNAHKTEATHTGHMADTNWVAHTNWGEDTQMFVTELFSNTMSLLWRVEVVACGDDLETLLLAQTTWDKGRVMERRHEDGTIVLIYPDTTLTSHRARVALERSWTNSQTL